MVSYPFFFCQEHVDFFFFFDSCDIPVCCNRPCHSIDLDRSVGRAPCFYCLSVWERDSE